MVLLGGGGDKGGYTDIKYDNGYIIYDNVDAQPNRRLFQNCVLISDGKQVLSKFSLALGCT